jgi:hypothetical protein
MSKKSNNNDNSIGNIVNNAGSFFLSILVLTIIVCFHFSFGSFLLFVCKVAQSNILPTKIDCKPYSDNPINIQTSASNIFITKPPKSDEKMSLKIKFPNNETNSKNILIDIFRGFKESPESFFLINYFIGIFEYLLCFNYYVFNFLFNSINGFFNESLIIVLSPLIMPIIFTVVLLINQIYLMFLWFEKMSWFFKTNVNNAYEGRKPQWENVTIFEPFSYFFALFLVFVFFLLFFIVGLLVFPFIAVFVMMWAFFSMAGYTGVMENKDVGILDIIVKVFKYHKVTFMVLLCFLIIASGFSTLGSVGGLLCLVSVLLMYFGIVPSNIFTPEIPIGLSTLAPSTQAKKTCSVPRVRNNRGFFYNLFTSLFFPQKGGSDLIQQIKQIGGKLKSREK